MRILIIGGTKFIGPFVIRKLVARGHEVTAFHRGSSKADLPASVGEILGDRRHLAEHAEEFRRFAPEVVIDMIALTEDDARGLVAAFRGLAKRSVVISSADVYRAYGRLILAEEAPLEPIPIAEDAPLRASRYPHRGMAKGPDDAFYHYDKVLVERAAASEPSLPATILRLPMVYGPGDEQHRLFPYLKRMDDGRPAVVLDAGMARWRAPRGYVEDVAAAIALAATDPRAEGRTYNVSEERAWAESEWVARIADAVGWGGRILLVPDGPLPMPLDTSQDFATDSARIRAELGYSEAAPFDEALQRTIAWERANPPEAPLDYAAEDALFAKLGV